MVKVSVIIPIYKVEKYIEKCACSLFEQTLDDMEFIFVDDCTPDNSIYILQRTIEKYPKRRGQVKIIHHTKNKGLTHARNSGLKVALGEYIAHVDSDDWVDVRMYEMLYNKAVETHSDVVYCNFFMVFKDHEKKFSTVKLFTDRKSFLKNYMVSGWTAVWNMIVKRSLYQTYKLTSPISFSYCEDFHLSVRVMFYANKIEKIETPLYFYNRCNVNSLLSSSSTKSEIDERICYTDLISFFEKEGFLEDFKQELSWKIINTKQMIAMECKRFHEFNLVYPESNAYILTCPFINFKMKIIMWLLSHDYKKIAQLLLTIRDAIK